MTLEPRSTPLFSLPRLGAGGLIVGIIVALLYVFVLRDTATESAKIARVILLDTGRGYRCERRRSRYWQARARLRDFDARGPARPAQ